MLLDAGANVERDKDDLLAPAKQEKQVGIEKMLREALRKKKMIRKAPSTSFMNLTRWLFAGLISLHLAFSAQAAKKPVVQARTEIPVDAAPWSLAMARNSRLDIKGVIGSITISRATGDEARVEIERDAGVVTPRIELLTTDQGFTFCAIYPSPNPKKPNECVPGGRGRMLEGFKKDHPAVRFKVSVPEGVEVLGRLYIGEISANAGATDLNLEVLSGNIVVSASTAKYVQAEAKLIGDVDVTLAANPEERFVRLTTMNGAIRAAIPKGRVFYNIQSPHRIDTPFELEAGAIPENWMGTLGDGGKTLHLTLSSALGRIKLRPE